MATPGLQEHLDRLEVMELVRAERACLRSHPVECLGSTMRFDNPTLNVASGLPNELLQAGRTASEGWGAVRQPL